MTAAVTWGIKSCTFTPAGGTLESFTDLTDMSFDDSINLQELLTDNNVNINLVFGTGGKTECTIKSTDSSLGWRSTSPPGTAGILVMVFGKVRDMSLRQTRRLPPAMPSWASVVSPHLRHRQDRSIFHSPASIPALACSRSPEHGLLHRLPLAGCCATRGEGIACFPSPAAAMFRWDQREMDLL